jgi:hypothetical protein
MIRLLARRAISSAAALRRTKAAATPSGGGRSFSIHSSTASRFQIEYASMLFGPVMRSPLTMRGFLGSGKPERAASERTLSMIVRRERSSSPSWRS